MIARQKQPELGTVRALGGYFLCISAFEEMGESGFKLRKVFQKRRMDILKGPPASKPDVFVDKGSRRLSYLAHAAPLRWIGGL